MKRFFLLVILSIMLVFALTLAFAQAPTSLGTDKNPIVMFFDPYGDVSKLEGFAKEFITFLEQKTNLKFAYNIGTSYAPSVEAMGANKAQMGWLNPFSYIVANKKYGVQLGLVVVRYKTALANGEIITNKASGIKTMADLKGKTFSVVPNSLAGYMTGYLLLKANGIDLEKDFKKIISPKGHRFTVVDVYKGDADAGAVFADARTDARLNLPKEFPDMVDKVAVLATTVNFPNEAIAFTKDFPADLKAVIVQALLDIAGTADGAKFLATYPYEKGVDGFTKRDDSFFNDLRELINKSGVDPSKFVPKEPPRS
jgi:phosphonate transport system substrate-binding protein